MDNSWKAFLASPARTGFVTMIVLAVMVVHLLSSHGCTARGDEPELGWDYLCICGEAEPGVCNECPVICPPDSLCVKDDEPEPKCGTGPVEIVVVTCVWKCPGVSLVRHPSGSYYRDLHLGCEPYQACSQSQTERWTDWPECDGERIE